ncbi:M48 family metalloprotease, partial [Burkholderia cenocepacia]|nr:M48 family metalloprotease [Burkholderia cenocepacia]
DALRARIESLMKRCGFAAKGLFVMDGSRRSAHGNAYFTGFGASKRIVFFDTLLARLSGQEIEAVLAHELGHFKRRHVMKRMRVVEGRVDGVGRQRRRVVLVEFHERADEILRVGL